MLKAHVITVLFAVPFLASAPACRANDEVSLLDSATLPLARGADDPSSADAPTTSASVDPALGRAYGPSEMQRHECTTLQADGTISGLRCPPGFVVFGPYVAAPANTNLRLRFDVESSTPLFVSGDIVSNLTRQFHGSFGDQPIAPKQKESFDYKVNLPLAAEAVEARIFIRGNDLSTFAISNLVVALE